MTPKWKLAVVAEMKRRNMTVIELARAVGTTGPNISMTLKPIAEGGYEVSAFAVRIGEHMHVPLPGAPINDKMDRAIALLQELEAMSDMAYDLQVEEIAKTVARQRAVLASVGSSRVRKPRNRDDK